MSPSPAVKTIHDAWARGFHIVPFLGAGVSSASGFPLTTELREYFCKAQFFLSNGIYRYIFGDQLYPAHTSLSPTLSPADYIARFGWPDFNQLNVDLNTFCDLHKREWGELIKCTPTESQSLSKQWGTIRGRQDTIVTEMIFRHIRYEDENTEKILRAAIRDLMPPRVDWFKLLFRLVEGKMGLIDGLFTQLNEKRKPGLAQLLLVHMSRLLNTRTFLTLNFDTLLEAAFLAEGLSPVVFDISRDATPPDPVAVQKHLAIVKLHGSRSNIRLGEIIDHALDEPTRSFMNRTFTPRTLLLVLGFSGYERRMMQLIESFAFQSDSAHALRGTIPRILWLHHEQKIPHPAEALSESLTAAYGDTNRIAFHQISDAGLFLLEVYQALTATIPHCRTSFSVLPRRLQATSLNTTPPQRSECMFSLFVRHSLMPGEKDAQRYPAKEIPLQLSMFARQFPDYRVIWIDLEDHHTLDGVVLDIVAKLRGFDPSLPPFVPQYESPLPGARATRDDRATRFIHRALHRGKYLIAFASFESFPCEHTAHHGLPDIPYHKQDATTGSSHKLVERASQLCGFIHKLCLFDRIAPDGTCVPASRFLPDCRIAIGIDEPCNRHYPLSVVPGAFSLRDAIRQHICDFVDKFVTRTKTCNELYNVTPLHVDDVTRVLLPPDNDKWMLTAFSPVMTALRTTVTGEAHDCTHTKEFRTGFSAIVAAVRHLTNWHRHIPDAAVMLREYEVRHPEGDRGSMLLGLLLVLAIFRRPSPRAAIVHLWDMFLPSDADVERAIKKRWIQSRIQALLDNKLIDRMDGDLVWIRGHLHHGLYKLSTECIRAKRLARRVQGTGGEPESMNNDLETAEILRFVIRVHDAAARWYYFHCFLNTHDYNALCEYLYHRVSCIKYATLLRTAGFAHESLLPLGELREEGVDPTMADNERHSHNSPAATLRGDTSKYEAWLARWVRALYNVLRREYDTIISTSSAEAWLEWIDQLAEDVAAVSTDNRRKSSDLGSTKEVRATTSDLCGTWIDLEDDETDDTALGDSLLYTWLAVGEHQLAIQELKDWLRTIRVRLLLEKSAYEQCGGELLFMLDHFVGQIAQTATDIPTPSGGSTDAPEGAPNIATIERCITDLSSKGMRILSTGFAKEPVAAAEGFRKYLDALYEKDSLCERDIDRLLACTFDSFKAVAVCARRREGRKAAQSVLGVAAAWRKVISEGVAQWFVSSGVSDNETSSRMSNGQQRSAFAISLNSQVSRRLFQAEIECEREACRFDIDELPHWTDTLDWEGRPSARWLEVSEQPKYLLDRLAVISYKVSGGSFVDADSVVTEKASLGWLKARVLGLMGRTKASFIALDESEGGVRSNVCSHRFLLHGLRRQRAELHVMMADHALRYSRFETSNEPKEFASGDRCAIASAQLDLAETRLKEAEQLLDTVQRNTRSWGRVFSDRAQLRIQRLLLLGMVLEEGHSHADGFLEHVASIHVLLSEGLEDVHGARESLGCSGMDVHDQSCNSSASLHPYTLWRRLCIAGYVALKASGLAALSLRRNDGGVMSFLRESDRVDSVVFLERWRNMTKSVGLDEFVDVKDEMSALFARVQREAPLTKRRDVSSRELALWCMTEGLSQGRCIESPELVGDIGGSTQ